MSALKNGKHEKFAQAVAKNENPANTYQNLYGVSEKSSAECASRLTRNGKVSARIDELRSRAEQLLTDSLQKRAEKLADIDFGTVLSIAEKRAFLAAVVRTPLGKLDAMSPLIHSLETTGDTGPDAKDFPINKLKAHDKLRAIELDSKLAGELTEKVDATSNGETIGAPQVTLVLPASFVQRRGQHASSN